MWFFYFLFLIFFSVFGFCEDVKIKSIIFINDIKNLSLVLSDKNSGNEYGNDVDQNILSKENAYLLPIGSDLRFTYKSNLSANFDYGFQLKEIQRRFFKKNIDFEEHLSVCLEL